MFDPRKYLVPSMRLIQLLGTASLITCFIWATSDLLLLHVLVNAPVAPLSILLGLYGTVGIILPEIAVRIINKRFLPQPKT